MIKKLPIIIDPHVHFRVPGAEYKEDWITGALATLHGGIGMVFDMPNNDPAVDSFENLKEKKEVINTQLSKVKFPLKYKLYFGATANNFEQIKNLDKNDVVGIKLFMGSSTGNLLVDKDEDIKKVFKASKDADLIVSVHAEDEEIIKNNTEKYKDEKGFEVHSKIRNKEAAVRAVKRAINIAREVGNRLYICHVSTKEELDLIKKAKQEGLEVYCEVCTHHLFFTTKDYSKLGGKVKMNPPLREQEDIDALWEGLNNGTIDTIGTDHAPHILEEKAQNVWNSPPGVPGVETLLPLMLNSVNEGKISLDKLSDLMHNNIIEIFKLNKVEGNTVVDMDLEKEVKNENLKIKCKWSPYEGMKLKGWPVKILINNMEYKCNE